MEDISLTKQLGLSCNASDMDSVYLVQTTADTPAILTEVFYGFYQSIQADAR
jgi:hypothetical protein